MFTPAKLTVLLTAALSVAAIPSHIARTPNHREIAARVAQPEVAPAIQIAARDIPVPAKRLTRKKRAGTGRCDPENSSVIPSSTPKESPTPSSDPAPSKTNSELKGNLKHSSTPPADPTTTPKDDPKSTSTSSEQPEPTTTPDTGSGGGDTYTGEGTFYETGLGACGIVNNNNQDIAAVSHSFFDSYPGYNGDNSNENPLCSKTAKVTYNGKTVTVSLTDRCGSCAYGDLDFSPHAFNQLADPAEGRIKGISWEIID